MERPNSKNSHLLELHFVIYSHVLTKIYSHNLNVESVLFWGHFCCRKEDPFQGPKLGSCLTLRKELSEETRADKARDFIGKGHPGGEQ